MIDFLAELRAKLESRAIEAEALHATAPLADTLRWVLGQLDASNGSAANGNGHKGESVQLVTVQEAAERLNVPPRWIYRHADSLPFVRRLGPKTMRCEVDGMAKWAAKR